MTFGFESDIIKCEKTRGIDMTKIAVLSDIHGNTGALEAVLADDGKGRSRRILALGGYSHAEGQDEKTFFTNWKACQ